MDVFLKSSSKMLDARYFVRMTAVLMPFIYSYFIVKVGTSNSRFDWWIFSKQLIVGSILYFGLLLITTDFAAKWRMSALSLFLPSFLLTPIIMLYFHNYLLIPTFVLMLVILVKFFPWRKSVP